MKAFNNRTGKILADNVTVADNLFSRMKGLLGKSGMSPGEALWIKPCMSIHTFWMKFPIDVIFLDKKGHITAAVKNMTAGRMTRLYLRSASVLELPSGVVESTGTEIGDEIGIE